MQGVDPNAIVFPVPPPEVPALPSQPESLLQKRDASKLPLATPSPKRSSGAKENSLLHGYAIEQIDPIGKVDRTCFYDRYVFHKQDATKDGPQTIEIRPGNIIALWQYGNTPFIIKGLTNNKGTSVIWKAIVQQYDEEITEEAPPSVTNPGLLSPPKEEFSIQISEVWHIYTTTNEKYSDPQAGIKEKMEFIAARKRRNRERRKQQQDQIPTAQATIAPNTMPTSNPTHPAQITNLNIRPSIPPLRPTPIAFPPQTPHVTVQTEAFDKLIQSHAKTVQQLVDTITESRNTMTNLLVANQKATEKMMLDVTASLNSSANQMQQILAQNQEFVKSLASIHFTTQNPESNKK